LKAIHRYFRAAAEQGDPIAQYHLALFLKYLGDLIDIDREEIAAYQKWLDQAGNTDLARARVAEVREQLAREATAAERRRLNKQRRIEALVRVENDKMDMIGEIIVRAVGRMEERSEQLW
jgi:TPR repeat protein